MSGATVGVIVEVVIVVGEAAAAAEEEAEEAEFGAKAEGGDGGLAGPVASLLTTLKGGSSEPNPPTGRRAEPVKNLTNIFLSSELNSESTEMRSLT